MRIYDLATGMYMESPTDSEADVDHVVDVVDRMFLYSTFCYYDAKDVFSRLVVKKIRAKQKNCDSTISLFRVKSYRKKRSRPSKHTKKKPDSTVGDACETEEKWTSENLYHRMCVDEALKTELRRFRRQFNEFQILGLMGPITKKK